MTIATLISISTAGMDENMPMQCASPAKPGAAVEGGAGSHHLLDGVATPGKACELVPGFDADSGVTGSAVPTCEKHGPMAPRSMAGMTKEAAWCGQWWECQDPRCKSSALIPSPALKKQWAEMNYHGSDSQDPQSTKLSNSDLA